MLCRIYRFDSEFLLRCIKIIFENKGNIRFNSFWHFKNKILEVEYFFKPDFRTQIYIF